MRFSTEMFEYDIPRALSWIGSQIGNRVEKRVKEFEKEERRNPLLGRYYRDTFALEFPLAHAWRLYRKTGSLPKSDEYSIAYGFAGTTQRIYEALSPSGQTRLRGCLKDGAKGEYGFRPLAYEMNIAAHLVWKGYDVECVDLEGREKKRFDFLARKDGIEFEIECKTTSPDKGRKIHRKQFNQLSYELLPITKKLVDAGGGHVIRLTIPDRLETNKKLLAELQSIVASSVSGATELSKVGRAEYKALNMDHWPEPHESESATREFLNNLFGTGNRHVLWHLRPEQGFVAIGVESEKPDAMPDALAQDAKAAADQCTGNRPALITIQLVDITPDELAILRQTSSGIQFVAHQVFKNDKRSHVDSVVFSLPPVISSQQLSGTVAVLNNPSPKIPSNDARGLFR
jgi:hypothetical protein